MNKEQRKELKRLAAEATPGPWIAAGPSFGGPMPVYCNDVCVDREGDDDDTYSVFGAPIGMDKEASSDMEYIAAANPQAITALLDALEAAEAENERLRMALVPDMFWDWDDSEKNHGSIEEFLSDEYSNGCLEVGARFRIQRAAKLPDSYIEVTAIDDESGDATYIESDKAMEAK